MPKVNKTAQEESTNSLEQMSIEAVKGIIPYPVMISGVNRKVNTGNFENIDVYSGIAIPIMLLPSEGLDAFKEAALEASELGFALTSSQTAAKYTAIKEMISGAGRG